MLQAWRETTSKLRRVARGAASEAAEGMVRRAEVRGLITEVSTRRPEGVWCVLMRFRERDRSRLDARISRALVKQMASEYGNVFSEATQLLQEQEERSERAAAMAGLVRESVFRGVREYNLGAPPALQLALLDRGDRLLFNCEGEFTLTVSYREDLVVCGWGNETKGDEAWTLEVTETASGLQFRPLAGGRDGRGVALGEVEFLCSLIRLARSRSAARAAG